MTAVAGPPAGAGRAGSGDGTSACERELPGVLEAVARSLRSGAALPTALREAAATGAVAGR